MMISKKLLEETVQGRNCTGLNWGILQQFKEGKSYYKTNGNSDNFESYDFGNVWHKKTRRNSPGYSMSRSKN